MDNPGLLFLRFGLSGDTRILDNLMIFASEYLIYLIFFLIFILAFKGSIKEKKSLILILFSLPAAILLIKAIHLFIFEPRPFIAYHFTPLADFTPDASFPSRHATIIGLITFSYVFYKSKWTPLLFLFLIWIGLSRVYIGVHYPIDVIGGFVVGIISLIISKQLIKLIRLKFFSKSFNS